jgi:hypothetical protein
MPLDPIRVNLAMAIDAHGAYSPAHHIQLELLEESRAKKKFFMKMYPELLECWSQLEKTPTTKEMLRILKRANSIITNKLKHDEEIESSTGGQPTQSETTESL